MLSPRAANQRLDRLRTYRNRVEPDRSLKFMGELFKREVERPFKQLESVTEVWQRLLPPAVLEHTRLDGLSRGTLRVTVDSSPRLYELDRLLRGGLHDQIIREHKGTAFRKIKLVVGVIEPGPVT